MNQARRGGALAVGILLLIVGAATARHFLLRGAFRGADQSEVRANRVSDDLLDDWRRAIVQQDTTEIVFGSAAGRTHYDEPDPRLHADASGILSRDFGSGGSVGFACGQRVGVRFTRLHESALVVAIEAAGFDEDARAIGIDSQHVKVRVAGEDAGIFDFDLPSDGKLHAAHFPVPIQMIRRGVNRLELEFSSTRMREFEGVPVKLPYSATLVRMTIRGAGDAQTPQAPEPGGGEPRTTANGNERDLAKVTDLAVEEVAAVGGGPPRRALVLSEGTRLAMPVRLEAGRPRFVGSLYVHPDDGAASRDVAIFARLRAEPFGEQLVAKGSLDAKPGNPRDRRALELDVDLSTFSGAVATLEIDVAAPPAGAKPLRVALASPTLRGGKPEPPAALPQYPHVDGLRGQLKNANVVVILLDAASARHFSAYGAQQEFTPRLAAIANESLVFDGVTSPASYTLPSIGSIFTGLHPERHGVTESGSEIERRKLPAGAKTLAERMKAAGYRTLAIISNPNAGPEPGYDRGFDVFDRLYANPELWNEGVAPEAVTDAVLKQIDRAYEGVDAAAEQPFFAYVHYFPPHAPYRAPAGFRKNVVDEGYGGRADGTRASIDAYRHDGVRYDQRDLDHLRQLYDANLKYADFEAGRLLDQLAARGRMKRTIVVVLGDHGEAFGQHSNLEHGDTTFGEEIEVPWFMRLPRDVDFGGMRVRGPCSLIDFAPTLLSLLGIEAEASQFDGLDLVARILPRSDWTGPVERPLVSRSVGFKPRYVVRMFGHAYHEDVYTHERWLFDLAKDPAEKSPLPIDGSLLADYMRLRLCRFLCNREAKGERITLTPAQIEQVAQIGYAEGMIGKGAAEATCPLLNR